MARLPVQKPNRNGLMLRAKSHKVLGTPVVLGMGWAFKIWSGTRRRIICSSKAWTLPTWVILIFISPHMALPQKIPFNELTYGCSLLPDSFSCSTDKFYSEVHFQANKELAWRLKSHFFKKLKLPPGAFVPFCVIVCRYVFRHQHILIVYTLSPTNCREHLTERVIQGTHSENHPEKPSSK